MKYKVQCLVVLILIVTGSIYASDSMMTVTNITSPEQQLRLYEPPDSISRDLEGYIPGYMQQENIPGLAICLICEGKIAWSEGFGKANAINGIPVTSETLFEVASNSKIVTAYAALRLVDQGILSFDIPLNEYLSEPWLPSSEYRDVITLRHVLSHTSGLDHNSPRRENLFAPGAGWSYSNTGFSYFQAVIEQVSGKSLEELASTLVFEPLGMSSSSFINRSDLTDRTANGHVSGKFLGRFFGIFFILSMAIVWIPLLLIMRIFKGHWLPGRRLTIIAISMSSGILFASVFILFGFVGYMKYAWQITFFSLIVIFACVLVFYPGRVLILRLSSKARLRRKLLTLIWGIMILAGFSLILFNINNIPVPRWPSVRAMAPASLRATADDMAALLIELSDSRFLSEEMAQELRTPQKKLSKDISWGPGVGIQHSQQGDALWQWGQNPDFQSLMIIYPGSGFGVVVLTNSESIKPDVAIEIARRAIGGKFDAILLASHLEFSDHEITGNQDNK